MVYKLNYNLISVPEYTATFVRLPKELELAVANYPNTAERIECALMFCAHLSNCDPQQDQRASMKAGAYFRAALSEYASVEEILNQELPSGKPRFRLLDTQNPLPHVLKQLRNLQLHLIANKVSDSIISLWLKLVPGAEPVAVSIWTINDLSGTQLEKLDAFKPRKGIYSQDQAAEMAEWLNNFQSHFGIADVIHRGINEVEERIVCNYVV